MECSRLLVTLALRGKRTDKLRVFLGWDHDRHEADVWWHHRRTVWMRRECVGLFSKFNDLFARQARPHGQHALAARTPLWHEKPTFDCLDHLCKSAVALRVSSLF